MRRLLPVLVLMLATPALAQEAPGGITVTGEGSVQVAPDMAQLSVGVTSEAKTAEAAMSANSDAAAEVLSRLKAAGIAERDVQTSGLSLYPRRDDRRLDQPGEPPIVGFVASNTLQVRVRDLDALGGILDEVVSGGANTLNGLSFGLQDPSEATDEARRRAVADAQAKAALYADAAGVTLGPVRSIDEQGGAPRPMMMEAAGLAKSGVPVASGELEVSASVTMAFGIAP